MSLNLSQENETPPNRPLFLGSSIGGSFGPGQNSGSTLFGNVNPNNASTSGGLFGNSLTGVQIPCQSRAEGSPKIATEPFDELTKSLMRLFTSASYSDLTIKCGETRYKVHKAIICPRSTFFEAACNSAFKEATTGEIDLPDDDALAVKMMIHYFYQLDYSVTPAPSAEDQPPASLSWSTTPMSRQTPATPPVLQSFGATNNGSSTIGTMKKRGKKKPTGLFSLPTGIKPPSDLSLHAKVYALAEKYDINGLKALAVKKFEDEVEDNWDSDDFLLAAQEVYTSTPDHDRFMRDVVVATFSRHSCLLDKPSVQDVVKGLDLAFDLLMHFRKRHGLR